MFCVEMCDQAVYLPFAAARAFLPAAEIERRRAAHGPNVIEEAPPRSVLALLLAALLLGERVTRGRLTGAIAVAVGVALISLG